jgi:hypothetical protein
VPVYLAREVIRFHYGTVHVGQGIDGPELMIALRSRRVEGLFEVDQEQKRLPARATANPFKVEAKPPQDDSDALPASA